MFHIINTLQIMVGYDHKTQVFYIVLLKPLDWPIQMNDFAQVILHLYELTSLQAHQGSPVVDAIKLYLEEIQISPKLRNRIKFVLMTEPAQNVKTINAIFKQNNALELFISLKMAISCCFGLRGNLDFPDFLQIKFYNINYSQMSRRKVTSLTPKISEQRQTVAFSVDQRLQGK